ncbi:hypothetical protein BD779DRAFT_1472127 [Infundibulicybe gibba]|nr:hypothetical protein BD779DRAFT_1472127 [Infundibulicybe gibba]
MDRHYNIDAARNALEQLGCSAPEGEDRRLASLVKVPDQANQPQVARFEHPQTWRLIKNANATEEGTEKEEMVFTVAGVITVIDFPPMERRSVALGQYKFFRQSLTITGLGSPTFEAAVEATSSMFAKFQRQFPEGTLEVWQTPRYQSHSCLAISNRYLTPRRDAPNMEHIPFDPEVDPHGQLESVIKDGYVHGEENIVEYYTQMDKDGKKSFLKCGPQNFRLGDMVEAQMSLVVVPLRKQKFKMMAVLRAIALLDSSFSQEATTKRSMTANTLRPTSTVSLKRKVGYGTERETKKGNMEVDV